MVIGTEGCDSPFSWRIERYRIWQIFHERSGQNCNQSFSFYVKEELFGHTQEQNCITCWKMDRIGGRVKLDKPDSEKQVYISHMCDLGVGQGFAQEGRYTKEEWMVAEMRVIGWL